MCPCCACSYRLGLCGWGLMCLLALQDGAPGREANALRAAPVLYLLRLGDATSTRRVFLGPPGYVERPPNHIYYLPTHARHALPCAACVRVCCTCMCAYNQKTDGVLCIYPICASPPRAACGDFELFSGYSRESVLANVCLKCVPACWASLCYTKEGTAESRGCV